MSKLEDIQYLIKHYKSKNKFVNCFITAGYLKYDLRFEDGYIMIDFDKNNRTFGQQKKYKETV